VIECGKNEAETVKNIVMDSMIQGMQHYIKQVPILAEASIGASWADK